ncbi:hypothetical protein [Flavobacterium sp.]|jgi:sorbitol-specific phosphotransferase system component IIBC|uniref:hypothetical protein n=1 Tax=Flavobacterium sp. TaxID=239 RepID=UPI0037BF303E
MNLFHKLINHFVGNIAMWIFYGGKKTIEEVAKNDNSFLGFITVIILAFILFYSFK